MSARIAAFVVWAAVAACAAYWGLRILTDARPVPEQARPVSTSAGLRGDLGRLFAGPATTAAGPAATSEPALAARFKLIGVMAPPEGEPAGERGIALIAVDDKPPRPYRVGASLDTALVLQSVAARSAALGPPDGPPSVQLELPPLPPPSTGSLPPPPTSDDPGRLGPVPAPGTPAAAPRSVTPPPAPARLPRMPTTVAPRSGPPASAAASGPNADNRR